MLLVDRQVHGCDDMRPVNHPRRVAASPVAGGEALYIVLLKGAVTVAFVKT